MPVRGAGQEEPPGPSPPPSRLAAPHLGPATSGDSQAPTLKRLRKKAVGGRGKPGCSVLSRGWNSLRDGGGGPQSHQNKKVAFRFKRRHPVFPAFSRWKLRPHARVSRSSPAPCWPAPPSHSPVPRGRRASPGLAPRRRRPSAGGGAAPPYPRAHGGGRRAATPALALPGTRPGGPLSLPRAPRLARQAPSPGSAAALTASLCACAAHLRVPLGGRGGDEVRVGAGDLTARPGLTSGLGGTTGL